MKNIILKKVIPIISVISILISCFCFSVSAETYWQTVTPSTCFARFYMPSTSSVKSYSYSPSVVTADGTEKFYGINVNFTSEFQNVFFLFNISGDGIEFKKGVNYQFKFKLVMPEVYDRDHANWSLYYTQGLYNWKSVNWSEREKWNFPLYETTPQDLTRTMLPFPSSAFGSQMTYLEYSTEVVPTKDMNILSFGVVIPLSRGGWTGWLGVSGVQVGMPQEYAPLPNGVPSYDSNNTDNMHNIETNINNQNAVNIQASTNLFSDFGSTLATNGKLYKGIMAVTNIFSSLFSNLDWAQTLLVFSLTLGLVAFLLGSGVSIYNQGHNKAVRERRRNKGGGN